MESYYNRYYNATPFITLVVDSIGFDTIGSAIHRSYYIDTINSASAYAYKLIEGVGSRFGLLQNTLYSMPIDHDLLCFTNGSGFYPKGISSCDIITSIESEIKGSNRSWSFFPNPTTGKIMINPEWELMSIMIYSTNGRKVLEKNQMTGANNELNIEGPPGVYVIQFQTSEGELTHKKVIKQ